MSPKKIREVIDSHNAWLESNDGRRADLRGAVLTGAVLRGNKISGSPIFVEPIGSEKGKLEIWPTEHGVRILRGCFHGSVDEFLSAVRETHGYGGDHGVAYRTAVEMALAALRARGVETEPKQKEEAPTNG